MAEKDKVKVPRPDGSMVDGVEVAINEATERWNEYKLTDGAEIRIKFSTAIFVRIDNEFDQEGNPVYMAKGTISPMTIKPAEEFRKKSS